MRVWVPLVVLSQQVLAVVVAVGSANDHVDVLPVGRVRHEMAQSGRPPKEIVEEKGLVQVSDAGTIEAVGSSGLKNCAAEVEEYKNGKTKLMGFFVGQVMKATKGKANPKMVNEILKKALDA